MVPNLSITVCVQDMFLGGDGGSRITSFAFSLPVSLSEFTHHKPFQHLPSTNKALLFHVHVCRAFGRLRSCTRGRGAMLPIARLIEQRTLLALYTCACARGGDLALDVGMWKRVPICTHACTQGSVVSAVRAPNE